MTIRSLQTRRFPFVGLLIAASGGVFFEEVTSFRSCYLFIFCLLLALIVLVQPAHQLRIFLFVACCFATLHAWQWQESPGVLIASIVNHSVDDCDIEGVVTSEVKLSKTGNASFFLSAKKIEIQNQELSGLGVPMLVHWEGPIPAYGDLVHFRAIAKTPASPRNPGEFDYVAWLARQGIFTELSIDPSNPGEILSSGHGFFLMHWALACHHKVEKILELGIEEDPRVSEIIQGITLGKKEKQNPNDDFRLTGTLHLFVISGLHVGMLAMMVWFFLKLVRLPRRLAISLTIPLLFFYVIMTGLHIGSLRAAIMASLVLIGLLFSRRPQILNSLAAAAFLLLLENNNLLFSVGWQFSFLVVLAILLLATPLQKWMNQHNKPDPFIPVKLISSLQHFCHDSFYHFTQLVAVSMAAWIGSLIPCLVYFHYISFSALGANLFAVPLAFAILAIALGALIFGALSSTMASILNNANWLLAKSLLLLVHWFAILPASSFYVALPTSVDPIFTIFDLPHTQAAVLQSDGKTWLVGTGRTSNVTKTIVPFLESVGINELSGLLVTEKKMACFGGVSLLQMFYPSFPIMMPEGNGCSTSVLGLLKKMTVSQRKIKMLHAGNKVVFSTNCFGEILYPPTAPVEHDSINSILICKLHLGTSTLLIMPKASSAIEAWLLEHYEADELKANFLETPLENITRSNLGEKLLAAISPQKLIVPSDPHNALLKEEAKSLLDKYKITLLCQEQTGALQIKVMKDGAKVKSFLKQ